MFRTLQRLFFATATLAVFVSGSSATPAASVTWTPGNNGGDGVTWDATSQNWSGAPAWVAGTDDGTFANDGDTATIPAATNVVPTNTGTGMTFNGSATVNGSGVGSGIGFVTTTSALTINVAAAETGTINAHLNGSAVAAADTGNKVNKVGSGKLVLNGTVSLVGDVNSNLAAGFTVEGGELELTAGLKAASALQANRSNFANTIGGSSGGNTLTISGASGATVYGGSLNIGANATGGNTVNISRPGTGNTLGTASYLMSGNGQQLNLGINSSNNSLTVSNGARFSSTQGGGTNTWSIGLATGANNNTLTVTGTGSQISRSGAAGSFLAVGQMGDSNTLMISSGGTVIPRRLGVGTGGLSNTPNPSLPSTTPGGKYNSVVIDGALSNLTISGDTNGLIQVGSVSGANGNNITVQNGGLLTYANTGTNREFAVGMVAGATNNYLRVTGSTSNINFTHSQPLTIGGRAVSSAFTDAGNTAVGNHLDVFSGGTLTSSTSIYLGGGNTGTSVIVPFVGQTNLTSLNLGDGTGISTVTAGAATALTPYVSGVFLSNANTVMNINSGRLIAGSSLPATLVSGSGTVNLLGDSYFSNPNGVATLISSQITGPGDLLKEGSGILELSNVLNNYTGDTEVLGGILRLDNALLADASTVSIDVGARMNLAFAGSDTIQNLFLGGVQQAAGTYGRTGSGATYINDTYFSDILVPFGTGILNVTEGPAVEAVPEPSALVLAALGLAGLGVIAWRRRTGE